MTDDEADEFSGLWREHQGKLWRYALRLAKACNADAEDLLHDALLQSLRKFAAFERGRSFVRWLGGFLRNVALHDLRWRSRHPIILLELGGELDRPTVAANQVDASSDVVQHLASLSAREREAVWLLHGCSWTSQQAASEMRIRPGRARAYASAGLRRLQATTRG